MTTPTIDQILTALTPAQARAAVVDALIALKVPADKWAKGGVASSIVTACGNVLSMLSGQLASGISAFFLPTAAANTAAPGLIQLLATYVYGIAVPQASFASGPLTLTNTGGAIYTVAAGQLTAQNADTGAIYVNEAAFTLGAGQSLNVTMECTIAGTPGNANPGRVVTLVTPLLGVSCFNAVAFVAVDAPTNPQIMQLCLDSLGIRSVRGPRSAYNYAISVATNPVTGAPVNINRRSRAPTTHTGLITIVVAGPSGTTDPNDVLGVATSVEALARPEGITISVVAANPVAYSPGLTAWVTAPAGMTAATVQSAIQTSLAAFLTAYPIGGVSASDDAHPAGFTGVLATGVVGAVGQGVATVAGCTLRSVQGAIDLALGSSDVATNSLPAPTVRLLAAA